MSDGLIAVRGNDACIGLARAPALTSLSRVSPVTPHGVPVGGQAPPLKLTEIFGPRLSQAASKASWMTASG
jgi:hypothetical protein